MAFLHGRNTKILYSKYDLTSYFRGTNRQTQVDMADTTTYGVFDKTYVVGFRDSTISLEGVFDAASASTISPVLSAQLGSATAQPITVGLHHPWAAGGAVLLGKVLMSSYAVSAPYTDMVSANADFQSYAGIFDGYVLHPGTAITTGTNNGTAHNNGAATTSGLIANLHVTANTLSTATDFKLQDSPDGTTWTDVSGGAFTQVALGATASESIRLSSTASVAAYVRIVATIAGSPTGSATYYAAYARPAV